MFVLQVPTGKEPDIRDQLRTLGYIAKVPQELRSIRKDGKWVQKVYTLFPSYVFVQAPDITHKLHYAVKDVFPRARFLGSPKPQPLTYLEAEYINLLAADDCLLPSTVVFEGDRLIVLEGVLDRLQDNITKIDKRQRRVKVAVPMLGECKPVEFSIVMEEGQDAAREEEAEATS